MDNRSTTGTQAPRPDRGTPAPASLALSRLFAVRGLAALAVGLGLSLALVEMLYLAAAELGVRLLGPGFPALDEAIALWVHSFAAPALTVLFLGLTFLGIAPVMAFQSAVVVLTLAATRRPLLAWALLLTMIGEVTLEFVTKEIVHRARPEVFRLASATGYSFPSGHALASTCLYGFLAFFVLWPMARALGYRLALLALGVALPLGIGLSRIYLGVHYPSDVLGGWLGGVIWLLCGRVVLGRLARQPKVAENPDATLLS